jgi:hypothetical protein
MKTKYFTENATSLENEIAIQLSAIWNHANDSTCTEWTKGINTILHQLAKDYSSKETRNILTACKSTFCNNQEWLWDFVWYENNTAGLDNIELIAESEWKNPYGNTDYFADLQYDFEKLIAGRSSHRLMIFEAQNTAECDVYHEGLKAVVKNCKLSRAGDRYMLACWLIDNQEFSVDSFVV